MNKILKRKGTALLLCLLLVVSSLSACKGKETSSKESEKTTQGTEEEKQENGKQGTREGDGEEVLEELPTPLTEEKETLRVYTLYSNSYVEDPNDLPGIQAMEEATNVHIEWITYTLDQSSEKWGLLLSSGNIPDLMYPAMDEVYTGGAEKAVEDGIFMDCTELVEKYMPNYRRLIHSTEELEKDTKTDDGRLISIYGLNCNDNEICAQSQWSGLVIRRDLLDSFGYTDTPVTIADWDKLLTVAKENGVEAPLLTGSVGYNYSASFLSAYGVLGDFYNDNGVVKYGAAEEGYRQWVELFRDWYDRGLLDPNFVSNDAWLTTDNSYAATGKSVAFQYLIPMSGNALYEMGISQDEAINLQPVLNPVLNEGDTPRAFNVCSPASGNEFFMAADCKNPKLAAMWMDFLYTDEGMRYNFYGVEGESYELVNGEIQLTDMILKNPDYSPSDALSLYARGNGIGRYNWGVANHYGNPIYGEYMDYLEENQDFSLKMPEKASMTGEEGIEFASLYTGIQTLTREMTVKFIMGMEPMEKYDEFVESLYRFDLQKCIDLKQAALDRYNER